MEDKEGKVGSGDHQRLASSIWGLRFADSVALGSLHLSVPCEDA